MPDRFPRATVVRLEANYRSTPEVLELANRIVPHLGGAEKVLRATRASGPDPVLSPLLARAAEVELVVERGRALNREGGRVEERPAVGRRNGSTLEFWAP